MEWVEVQIKQTSGKNVPFVSIGRGQLDFNAVACDLIEDNGNYKYVKLLKAKENGKTVVAAKFLTDAEPNTIPIKRKEQNGKTVKGITVRNKGVVSELFGKDGSNDGMQRHLVERIEPNMLKIVD